MFYKIAKFQKYLKYLKNLLDKIFVIMYTYNMETIDKNCGIYVIKFKNNPNWIYVGSSKNLKRRNYQHLNLLKNNKHPNESLQTLYSQNYNENYVFEIVENCVNDTEYLLKRETHWYTFLHKNYHVCNYINPSYGVNYHNEFSATNTLLKLIKKFQRLNHILHKIPTTYKKEKNLYIFMVLLPNKQINIYYSVERFCSQHNLNLEKFLLAFNSFKSYRRYKAKKIINEKQIEQFFTKISEEKYGKT